MSVNARKKPPPFANQIDDSHFVMIYCGSRAWELARPEGERVASLVFPKGKDPSEFEWPVRGRQVLVLALDEPDESVDILAIELLRAGADLVHVLYADGRNVDYDPKARQAAQ